jgi:hypothetical protein
MMDVDTCVIVPLEAAEADEAASAAADAALSARAFARAISDERPRSLSRSRSSPSASTHHEMPLLCCSSPPVRRVGLIAVREPGEPRRMERGGGREVGERGEGEREWEEGDSSCIIHSSASSMFKGGDPFRVNMFPSLPLCCWPVRVLGGGVVLHAQCGAGQVDEQCQRLILAHLTAQEWNVVVSAVSKSVHTNICTSNHTPTISRTISCEEQWSRIAVGGRDLERKCKTVAAHRRIICSGTHAADR